MIKPKNVPSNMNDYLSIREVLDELVEDFDDITISKIRFLESRGLIHPERTPSGYRKFYVHDIERLRWILRQQRENFLPLKVIKRRLDLEDGRAPELPDSPSLFDEDVAEVSRDVALANVVSNIRQATQTTASVPRDSRDTESNQAVVGDSVSSLHQASHETLLAKPYLSALPSPSDLGDDGIVEDQERHTGAKHPNHPSHLEPLEVQVPVAVDGTLPPKVQEQPVTPPITSARTPTPRRKVSVTKSASGECYSIDELALATTTDVATIAELEDFGFIKSAMIGGTPCFDNEALIVAKALIGLRAYGLEPRHLKTVKNAAERDAALYGQVVAPLLRQRNPEARDRARVQLEDIAERGVALYEQILRTELRRLGG